MVSRKGAGPWLDAHSRSRSGRQTGWLVPMAAVAIGVGVLFSPARATAQTGQPGAVPSTTKHEEGALLALGQNYPNPFSPATRIPFSVGNPPACSDPGRQYHVTLKVYNLLAQPVAVPVIIDASASSAPIGQPVQELQLTCGQYTAYWDGTGMATNRPVASGLYLYRLEINGKPVAARKMLIQR
jgi:hypothetical protein